MKIRDVTPKSFACHGGGCPAIYETFRGTYLIVGKKVEPPENFPTGKIGKSETLIEIPHGLIRGLVLGEEEEL